MTIAWTKCSERMPPNNHDNIIIRSSIEDVRIRYASTIHLSERKGMNYDDHEWTPYTPYAWVELNKK